MKCFLLGLAAVALFPGISLAADKVELQNEQDRINYSVGYQIGGDFKTQGVGLSPDALVKGIEDALAGSEPLMTPEERQTTLIDLKKKIVAEQERQRKEAVEKYRGEGREFLKANSGKEGVVTRPSGLQYKVLKGGTGRQPTLKDTVTVSYRGTLLDGREFDSSYRDSAPATFPLNEVIPGWKEAIPLMKEGAKWELYLPSDLAFGERGPLADRTVIYEVELLSVQPAEEQQSQKQEPKKASP